MKDINCQQLIIKETQKTTIGTVSTRTTHTKVADKPKRRQRWTETQRNKDKADAGRNKGCQTGANENGGNGHTDN